MEQTPMKKHLEWLKCRVAISKELEEKLINEETKNVINFSEWAASHLWIYKCYDDIWINYGGLDLRKLKSNELYNIFINL